MKNLWLVDSPDCIDYKKDIFLGPWCLEKKHYSNKNYNKIQVIPDPFSSLHEMRKAEKSVNYISISYLSKISNELNTILDTTYSIGYWRIILMPWLLSILQIIWLREMNINQFIDNFPKDKFKIRLLNKNIKWKFKDTLDFVINGALNTNFNYWLISRIIELKSKDNWIIEYTNQSSFELQKKYNPPIKEVIYNELIHQFPILSIKGMDVKSGLLLSAINIFNIMKNNNKIETTLCSDRLFDQTDKWSDVVRKTMPESFLEIKKKKTKPYKYNKTLIMCGSQLYYNEKLKQKAALSKERGAKIFLSQHGGFYGIAAVHSLVSQIEYLGASNYLSWGWEKMSYKNRNVTPLPSPYLSRLKYKCKSNNIIFVSSVMISLPRIINSQTQPNQTLNEKINIIQFLKHLSPPIFENLLYRPSLSYNGNGSISNIDEELIKSFLPKLRMLKGDLHDYMMNCKLLVTDAPNTTFYISMALNIPTLAFWDPNTYYIDEAAKTLFSNLHKLGIIHYNSIEVSNKINTKGEDIDDWWYQPSIQNARKEWATNFALVDIDWKRKWSKLIWGL